MRADRGETEDDEKEVAPATVVRLCGHVHQSIVIATNSMATTWSARELSASYLYSSTNSRKWKTRTDQNIEEENYVVCFPSVEPDF